jgi:hypothetical protein
LGVGGRLARRARLRGPFPFRNVPGDVDIHVLGPSHRGGRGEGRASCGPR